MKKLLVAYVTKTGSTKQVAEEVGKVLGAKGFGVDVLPLADVKDLAAYSVVVIGAPVNGMQWHPDAKRFVRERQAELASKPTAYFLLSLVYGAGRESLRKRIPGCLTASSALVAPVRTGVFGGVIEGEAPLILRLIFGIKKGGPRDTRDWAAIRRWAEELAGTVN
jgi:menaquinone-dependent protoporphyrinogen oxidase